MLQHQTPLTATNYRAHPTPHLVDWLFVHSEARLQKALNLSAYRNLRKLTISLHGTGEFVELETLRSLPLHQLESLTISCSVAAVAGGLLKHTPNLQQAVITLHTIPAKTNCHKALAALGSCTELRSLHLFLMDRGYNRVQLFGESPALQTLTKLETLYLSSGNEPSHCICATSKNALAQAAEQLAALPALRHLDLGWSIEPSRLERWRPSLALETLILRNQPATYRGLDLRQHPQLRAFGAYIVENTRSKNWIFPNHSLPPSIEKIAFSSRGLRALHIEPSRFPKLHTLDLSRNHLTELPDALAQLPELTRLHLSHNRFETVPKLLTTLTKLTELHLGHNKLCDELDRLAELPVPPLPADAPANGYHTLGTFAESFKPLVYYFFTRVWPICPADQRAAVLRALSRKSQPEEEIPLETLCALLRAEVPSGNYARLLLAQLEAQLQRRPPVSLVSGSSIYFLGKPAQSKTAWTAALKPLGIQVAKKIAPNTAAIVVCVKPEPDFRWPQGVPALTEGMLRAQTEARETPFLKQADAQENLESLERLLTSRDPNTIPLALEMLENGGVPPELITALYFVYRSFDAGLDTSQKRRAGKLLVAHGTEALKAKDWKRPLNATVDDYLRATEGGGLVRLKLLRFMLETSIATHGLHEWKLYEWFAKLETEVEKYVVGEIFMRHQREPGWFNLGHHSIDRMRYMRGLYGLKIGPFPYGLSPRESPALIAGWKAVRLTINHVETRLYRAECPEVELSAHVQENLLPMLLHYFPNLREIQFQASASAPMSAALLAILCPDWTPQGANRVVRP